MHPVILIIYFELIIDDSFERTNLLSISIMIEKKTFPRRSHHQKRAPQTAKKFIKEMILSNQIAKI
jgi:hypothetical protein